MSNINLNLYRIFCKVAQSKSYSDASEKLNLSVSNISTQITNLEEQLNLKLRIPIKHLLKFFGQKHRILCTVVPKKTRIQ